MLEKKLRKRKKKLSRLSTRMIRKNYWHLSTTDYFLFRIRFFRKTMGSEIEASGDLESEDTMAVENNESTEPPAVPTNGGRRSGRFTKAACPVLTALRKINYVKLREGATQS
jgi:hypothetical protein